MKYRQLLAVVVCSLLIDLPALSYPQTAAVAGPTKSATARGTPLVQGTNLYNGDTVEVSQDGDSVLLIRNGATVHVPRNGAVRIFKCADRTVVQLLRGELTFHATPKQSIEVQLGDAVIRSTPGMAVVGNVSLVSETTANLTAQQGSFTVSAAHEGRSMLVNQGETRQATLTAAADAANPNPPICGVAAGVMLSPSTLKWVVLGLGVAGVAGALGAAKTQPTLTCPQKGALVSPYQFPCP